MADTEFEQFRRYFERLPQYLKAPAHTYTLVHDISLDESGTTPTTTEHNVSRQDTEEEVRGTDTGVSSGASSCSSEHVLTDQESLVNEEDEDEGRGVMTWIPPPTRRRRKLPEIPKNKKSCVLALSLADELGQVSSGRERALLPQSVQMALRNVTQPVGAFQLRGTGDCDELSSPESSCPAPYQSLDADSGHSTTNSPDGGASLPGARRPASNASTISTGGICCNCGGGTQVDSPGTIGCGGSAYPDVSRLVATHRGLHKFIPRHRDEIEVEIGDPVYVMRECDDLWCEGVNMRTSRQGSFPSAYAVDLEYREFDPEEGEASGGGGGEVGSRRDRFLLDYLGSVESLHYKGNAVLCQAVRRIAIKPPPTRPVILEVSDMGLRMLGRDKHQEVKSPDPGKEEGQKDLDYFYSLKNVSFCGFHPRDQRFLGFITKHPQRQRFACHVFRGDESMRPVAETIGRAFERFYQKFIETAYPTEDIYIE